MTTKKDDNWQQQAIEKFAYSALKEQRARRRWGIFFKFVWLFIIFLIIVAIFSNSGRSRQAVSKLPHAALIKIRGTIMPTGRASADRVNKALRAAFKDKTATGLIIEINSPGGSAVQADAIYQEIMHLRKQRPKFKVYAVCSDVCASGAYFVAAAANDIYANPASIVGSIGVLMNGFGFVDTLHKLGVTRRLFKAGKYKDFLDPFSPLQPAAVAQVHQMLDVVHQQFINSVKKGRGDRLVNNPIIFSGLAWTGQTAKQLGLIDGFGSVEYVTRRVLKVKHIVNYTVSPNPLKRLFNSFGVSLGAAFEGGMIKAITQRDASIQASYQ